MLIYSTRGPITVADESVIYAYRDHAMGRWCNATLVKADGTEISGLARVEPSSPGRHDEAQGHRLARGTKNAPHPVLRDDLEAPHHVVILMGQNVAMPNPLAYLVEAGDDARYGS